MRPLSRFGTPHGRLGLRCGRLSSPDPIPNPNPNPIPNPNPNPNPNPTPTPNKVLFDSTVDDVRNPSIFVTYHDAQAYPDYLVRFRQ